MKYWFNSQITKIQCNEQNITLNHIPKKKEKQKTKNFWYNKNI
jgi:hypothetical protein